MHRALSIARAFARAKSHRAKLLRVPASYPLSASTPLRAPPLLFARSMASYEKLIGQHAAVKHAAAPTPADWKAALASASGAPPAFALTKTLVFKPKTAKGAVPVPVVIVAHEETETSAGALMKKLNVKELRLAQEDLIQEFFQAGKDSVSALAISQETFPKIVTVLDSAIATSDAHFAVRAPGATESTIFLKGTQLAAYYQSLPDAAAKLHVVDFVALKAEAGAAPPAKVAAPAKEEKKDDAKIEGSVQIAIGVKKEVDFPTWYTNVLIKADMLDYYSVSGCYILKPWSYSIWEVIQEWFNREIKKLGVENAYFPMFVSSKVLEREKNHIEGFAPEVAWVTRAGSSDLEEPIAIRPTSETAMYPYYAKWIQSHRDLPLKLNQWNSVVRWEFKSPQPFLRTREFLWQEGHTAHFTKPEADTEVRQILELYRRVYEELLAVPVIPGVKSEKEKFAGGLYTTTIEGFVPTSGRGIQAATSHCLGQNFSKMFNIVVEDPESKDGGKSYVWQNSWGLSTRSIGVMVMVHGDNQGLVLPPNVASVQAVVVPCGINAKTNKEEIYDKCDELAKKLSAAGIRAKADLRDGYTPGYKFNDWEQKGVPLRLELGPGDIKNQQTIAVRRDTNTKTPIKLDGVAASVDALLKTVQREMFERAKAEYDSRRKVVTKWDEVVPALDAKNVVVLPWCEVEECEDAIKERSARGSEQTDERAPSAGAKSLCIPFDQAQFPPIVPGQTKCPQCGSDAKRWTLFGRSY